MSREIYYRSTDAVAEIRLNRPAKLNAMTPAMAEQLARACRRADADDTVNVVVVYGAGDRAFCAGSDIHALDEYAGAYEFRNRVEYATQVRNLRKPTIAAVHGWAMGGGLEIALAADLRVADESARFGAPEVTLGWVGAGGASQMLPRMVGYGRAMRLLLTGEPIDASTAFDWGLVEWLVPAGEALASAREIAREIARHSPVATQTVKAAARQALSTPLEAGLRHENDLMALAFALGNDQAGRARFSSRAPTRKR